MALAATLRIGPALAADAVVLKAVPEVVGWYFYGDVEVGGRAYIQKPPTGFGRALPPDNWLTPRTTESIAKFWEYGEIPQGLFVDHIWVGVGTRDGLYSVDVFAKDVGYNNQSYYVTMEPGVIKDASGAPFAGFSDTSVWNFSTKTSAPAAGSTAAGATRPRCARSCDAPRGRAAGRSRAPAAAAARRRRAAR